MKLKEYPRSIWQSARLWLTPAERLKRRSNGHTVPVTVSFTTIPSRLPIVHITVRSLLNQSVCPQRILLWLNTEDKQAVPHRLASLQDELFGIRYADETGPHRKLVHTLRNEPPGIVVTCDDDVMYPADWLETLYREHRAYPNDVIANECRGIACENGQTAPYRDWATVPPGSVAPNTLAIGYGGVLYPPGCLHPDVTDRSQYDALTPRADDLWFKAMSLRAGTQTRRNTHPPRKPLPIPRSQRDRLGNTNIKRDGNREQWQTLMGHFPKLASLMCGSKK